MLTHTNNVFINKKIDAFYNDKTLSSQKELLDVYKLDGRYVYKVRCNRCGEVRITHLLSDCYTCSPNSQCYKDKMSQSVKNSQTFQQSRQKLKTANNLTDKLSKLKERMFSGDLKEHLDWYLSNDYTFEDVSYENGEYLVTLTHNPCGTKLTKSLYRFKQHRGCIQKQCKINKTRETLQERYNDPTYNNPQKSKITSLEKYGVEHYSQRKEFKQEVQQILQERYGSPTYNNREKAVQTLLDKYGTTSYNNSQLRVLNDLKKHMSQDEIDILFDKDKLLSLSKQCSSVREIASKLHADPATVRRYLYSYGIYKELTLSSTSSFDEKEVADYIQNIIPNVEIQRNVRGVIPHFELDIYIPSKKVAIEYNGLYWHVYPRVPKDYHYNKSKQCEEQGIRLIHVWEHEWDDPRKQPILKSIIKNALGMTDHKVYARNTYCSVEPSASMKEFVNTNNIAGFRGGKFAITLRDKHTHELLMCYIIGHAYFGKGKYQYEVIRGATKLNTTIVGGASKIWKYFLTTFKPKSCVYYIDYNYFNGLSVAKLGLHFVTSQPGIWNWWKNTNDVTNRDPAHHQEINELIEQGLVFPIYTAGTKVYVYEDNNI